MNPLKQIKVVRIPMNYTNRYLYSNFRSSRLTINLICALAFRNTMEGYCDWKGQIFCAKLRKFLEDNLAWMNGMIQESSSYDPYWHQVSC